MEFENGYVLDPEESGVVEFTFPRDWKKLKTEVLNRNGGGPWDQEPCWVQFKFSNQDLILNHINRETYCVPPGKSYTGLCVRNAVGAWCGYVLLEASHPTVKWAESQEHLGFWVHGGVTFNGLIDGVEKPEASTLKFMRQDYCDQNQMYAIGFDCAHAGDAVPMLYDTAGICTPDSIYRDLDYVKEQIKELAIQIAMHEQQL